MISCLTGNRSVRHLHPGVGERISRTCKGTSPLRKYPVNGAGMLNLFLELLG